MKFVKDSTIKFGETLVVGDLLRLEEDQDGRVSIRATGAGGSGILLDDLTDVTISAPSTGHILRYNGTFWTNILLDASLVGPGNFPTGSFGFSGGKITIDGTDSTIAAGEIGLAENVGNLTISSRGSLFFDVDNDNNQSTAAWQWSHHGSAEVIMSLVEDGTFAIMGGLFETIVVNPGVNQGVYVNIQGDAAVADRGGLLLNNVSSPTRHWKETATFTGSPGTSSRYRAGWVNSGDLETFLSSGPAIEVGPANDIKLDQSGTGSVIIGVDPGGSGKLRVGGGTARISNTTGGLEILGTSGGTTVTISGQTSQIRDLAWATNSVNRWILRTNSTTEAGGNAGSDLQLIARDDSGTQIDSVMNISRIASGTVTIAPSTNRPVVIGTDPGGTERLRVGGNIHAEMSAANVQLLNIRASAGTQNDDIAFIGAGGNSSTFNLLNIMRGASYLTETFRVGGDGTVVVGTDPTWTAKLRVGGNVVVSGTISIGQIASVTGNDINIMKAGRVDIAMYNNQAGVDEKWWTISQDGAGGLKSWGLATRDDAGTLGNWAIRAIRDGASLSLLRLIENSGALVIAGDPGGTEQVRIGGRGNVLIKSGTGGSLTLTSNNSGETHITFGTSGSIDGQAGELQIRSLSPLGIYTSGIERMIVNTDGTVVIGADPGGNNQLRVDHSLRVKEEIFSMSASGTQTMFSPSSIMFGTGSTGTSFRGGFSHNVHWNGANWRTLSDGSNSGGQLILGGVANDGWEFFTLVSSGVSNQTLTNNEMNNFYRRFRIGNTDITVSNVNSFRPIVASGTYLGTPTNPWGDLYISTSSRVRWGENAGSIWPYLARDVGTGGLFIGTRTTGIDTDRILISTAAITPATAGGMTDGTSSLPWNSVNSRAYLMYDTGGVQRLNISDSGGATGAELGRTDTPASAFIDFHSSGLAIDFDTRILSTGGNADLGAGTLQVGAAAMVAYGSTRPALGSDSAPWGTVIVGSGYGFTPTTANRFVAGGGGQSPNAASIAWGDNTGWKLNLGSKVSGAFSARVTFLDTGNVQIHSGSLIIGTDPGGSERLRISGDLRLVNGTGGIITLVSDGSGQTHANFGSSGSIDGQGGEFQIRGTSSVPVHIYANGVSRFNVTSSLVTSSLDFKINNLGTFDSTDTPTDLQTLIYHEGGINKWQAESIQFARGTSDFKAALLGDNTAAAYVLLDPGTGADSSPGNPPDTGAITVEIGHKAFSLSIPSYTKPSDFRYFEWQHSGTGMSNFAGLVNSTSRSVVHSRLTVNDIHRYRVRAVDRAGNVSNFVTTSVQTTVAQSDTQAFAGIIAGEISAVDLTALAGDIGILIAGQFRGSDNTYGINFGGVGGIPTTWSKAINFENTPILSGVTRLLNFDSRSDDRFIDHERFRVTHSGSVFIRSGNNSTVFKIATVPSGTAYWQDSTAAPYPITVGMFISSGINSLTTANLVDDELYSNIGFLNSGTVDNTYIGVDLGAGNVQRFLRVGMFCSMSGTAVWQPQFSDNGAAWTNVGGQFIITSGWCGMNWTDQGLHRYWRIVLKVSPTSAGPVTAPIWPWTREFEWYTSAFAGGIQIQGPAHNWTRSLDLEQGRFFVKDNQYPPVLRMVAGAAIYSGTIASGATDYGVQVFDFQGATALDFTGRKRMMAVPVQPSQDSGASLTIDLSTGLTQQIRLTNNNAIITLSNPIDGGRYRIWFQQDATAGRNFPTLNTSAGEVIMYTNDTPPTLTTATPGAMDLFELEYRINPTRRFTCITLQTNMLSSAPKTVNPTATVVSTASTTHNITLPPTLEAGDLMVMIFSCTFATVTDPTGWTVKASQDSANFSGRVYVKISDGTEDGSTVNVATGTSVRAIGHVYRVTSWTGNLTDVLVSSSLDTGAGTQVNPPSRSANTLDRHLWIAAGIAGASLGTGPSGYPTPIENTTTGLALATTRRAWYANPEDPGVFSLNTTFWVSHTIYVGAII